MKKLMLIVSAVLMQAGCAVMPQSDAVQVAVERGEYQGLNKDSNLYVTVPASHSGPYSAVDLFNFQTDDEEFKGKKMSAIVGKSKETGEWAVLTLFQQVNGDWLVVPKNK